LGRRARSARRLLHRLIGSFSTIYPSPFQQTINSLNHLFRAHLDGRRDIDADGVGGREVDGQFEFGRQLNGQIRGLLALDEAVDVAGAPKQVGLIGTVAEKRAGPGVLAELTDNGDARVYSRLAETEFTERSAKQRPVISQNHPRRVVAGGAGDAAAGMGAASAMVEAFQGPAIIGVSQHRPGREQLIERKRAVKDVAAEQAELAFEVERRQYLPADHT
jgi:hypothetical protein